MNSFADAFEKAGIKASDFDDVNVDEKAIENQNMIDFLTKWLSMCERGASAKEKYQFATSNGFVSEKHLNIWIAAQNDAESLMEEYEMEKDFLSDADAAALKKEADKASYKANAIREPDYYCMVMRLAKQQDYSPYGVDLLYGKQKRERDEFLRGFRYQMAHKRK